MRRFDGWPGTMPSSPARIGWVALAFVAAAALLAVLATFLGWATVLVAVAALLVGIALGSSDLLDDGDAAGPARSPDPAGTADAAGTVTRAPAAGAPRAPGVGPGAVAESAGGRTARDGGVASGVDETLPPTTPVRALAAAAGSGPAATVLRVLAEELGAARLVVWRREAPDGDLVPLLSTDRLPPPLPPRGEPLLWSLEQDQPMSLAEDPPRWAYGPLLSVPFALAGERALLTVETETGAGTAPGSPLPTAQRAATVLAVTLELTAREEAASSAHARFESVVDFLRDVPRDARGEVFADGLADAAAAVAGGIGAAVASWEGESGQVLAVRGVGGGPVPGTWFGVMEGDFAMAARAGAILHRDRKDGRLLPLTSSGERWTARPRFTGVVALRDALGDTRGLIAVWGDEPLAHDGLALLDALGPLLALQLHHATHLERFRQQATEDALTGLANRGALEERIDMERKRFQRYRRPAALLVLDLDHFKRINDTWGHPAGDAVLRRVADILRHEVRETDFVARYGGEELVVLMEETMRREASDVAERIRAAIADARFDWNDVTIPVTASIGVSACPECVDDPGDLLRDADEALYASKEGGRDRVTVAEISASGT